jgi:hypothetical protein
VKRHRLYSPQALSRRKLWRNSRFHYLYGYLCTYPHTLVRSDVIALAPKTSIPPDIPETALEDYLIPTHVRLGKTRWWKEWVKQEGKQIKRDWRLFLEQKRAEETEA